MLAVTVNRELLTRYQNVVTPTTVIGIVITIGIAGWLVLRLRAWFREGDGRAEDRLEMLTQFRDLRQQGELTEDEYRLIKSHLTRQNSLPPMTVTKLNLTTDAVDSRAENTNRTGETGPSIDESRFHREPSNVNLESTNIAQMDLSGMSSNEPQSE